jgi:hypothetical protein
MEGPMRNEPRETEEVDEQEEIDQCPECGHIWTDYEQGHYHDCRYFTTAQELEEEYDQEEELRPSQLSMFRPAA